VPIEHQLPLQKWIDQNGPAHVAKCLSWLANYHLYHAPTLNGPTLLYGLTAPELLHLACDLSSLGEKC
jgi:hypothetical protein